MIHHPRWYARTRSAGDAGDATTATNIATPIARPAWRIMLITPEPVANDDGGSDDAATPISVGKVSPTPMPVNIMPAMTTGAFGSSPIEHCPKRQPRDEESDARGDDGRDAETSDEPAREQKRGDRHQQRAGRDHQTGF